MSLTKEDKIEITDMIATGIAAAIATAKAQSENVPTQAEVTPKTTFDERRAKARKAKEKHDSEDDGDRTPKPK